MSGLRLLLALMVCAATAAGAELRTLKGDAITGTVVSVTPKEIVIDKGSEKVTVPVEQVMQLDLAPLGKGPPGPYSDVELNDGSLFHCKQVALKGTNLELELLGGQPLKCPLDKVANILFNKAHDERLRQEWSDRVKERLEKLKRTDQLVRERPGADKNDKTIITGVDGTINKVDAEGKTLRFILDGETEEREVNIANLHGIIFAREADAGLKPIACKLNDSNKNTIMAASVEMDGGKLKMTTACGVAVDYPVEAVTRLDYSRGKLVYLSDLIPLRQVEPLAEERLGNTFKDTNINNQPMRINGVVYAKGLAALAPTELVYDLNGEYREFRAVLGVDDQVQGTDGAVQCYVYLDDKEVFKQDISRKDKKRDTVLALNVKDRRKLKIVIKAPDDDFTFGVGRHLDIADAKVSK